MKAYVRVVGQAEDKKAHISMGVPKTRYQLAVQLCDYDTLYKLYDVSK